MSWDYIIVGAGSAGCAVACRLSADPKNKVLLLEAGGSHHSPLVTIPAGEARAIGNPKFDWRFETEPDPTVGGRQDVWPRGKVLGGSSSINGMMWIRGQREDYDGWAQLGNRGWSYADVLPYFRRSETSDIEDAQHHGDEGPVTVSSISTPHPLAKVFIAAGMEIGLPYNPDFNGAQQEGVGPIQGNIRRGRRMSTARSYLDPIRSRPNLKIVTQATVHRVLIEHGRAVGVVYARAGSAPIEVRCDGEVVLSAGTLASPLILMRSGIGPAAHLASHGLKTVNDLPGVGQNLQEHAAVWNSIYVNISTYNTELAPHKWAVHGLNWLLFGRGPASTPIAHAGAFIKTRPELTSPDVQFCFIPTGYKLHEHGLELLDRPSIVLGIYKCRPESVGHVELRSADPDAPPRIFARLLGAQEDIDATVAALKVARRMFATLAFRPYFEGMCSPGPEMQSDAELEAYVRQTAGPAYHPVGTCRMGPDPMAVVDDRLRVRGIMGLRVADASVMPRMPSGNTNAPSVMIGEKAADLITEDNRLYRDVP
jgi:choline dehydrogenase